MCSREEDERLVEVEGDECGRTGKRTNKPRKKVDDRVSEKKPNKIVRFWRSSLWPNVEGVFLSGRSPTSRQRWLSARMRFLKLSRLDWFMRVTHPGLFRT
jgi:hypothetical protein